MPRNRWRWAVRASTPYVCLKLSPPATCPHPTPPVSLPLHQEATSGLQLIPETQQLLTGPVKAQAKNCYLLNLQPHAVHRLLAWCRLIWRWQSLMENFLWISMGSGSRHSYQASSVTVMCEIWQERSRKKIKKKNELKSWPQANFFLTVSSMNTASPNQRWENGFVFTRNLSNWKKKMRERI